MITPQSPTYDRTTLNLSTIDVMEDNLSLSKKKDCTMLVALLWELVTSDDGYL